MVTELVGLQRPQIAQPLLACPQFSTTDPDRAVHEAARILAPHQMAVRGDPADFRADISWADVAESSLCYLNYQSPVTLHTSRMPFVAVILPISGDMAVSYEKGDEIEVPGGSCAIVPAGRRVEFVYRSAFSVFVVYAQESALLAGMRRIAPEVDTDRLDFDGGVATKGCVPGAFYGLSGLLVDVVNQYSSPELMPPNVAHAMSDQVLSTFLLSVPHSRTDQMMRSNYPASSRVVKRALDIVFADSYAQKTVADVATAAGVSVRWLELGFRRDLGCTPHAYIQNFRLQRAHEQLLRARPGDGTTVSDVAARWGFNHTGRFAALYRRTYGASPLQTLRNN